MRRRKSALIKSNNPHLAGGEQKKHVALQVNQVTSDYYFN